MGEIIEYEPSALQAITRGEIESAVDIAKRHPRSLARFKERALAMATVDQETAEECFYTVPRAGKNIQGPSIRLAEIVACCYGNIQAGSRIIREEEGFIVTQGAAHDLETNVKFMVEVRRRITYKNGERYNDDLIGVTANAASAIALRNAILKTVPGALVNPIYDAARRKAIGDTSRMGDRLATMWKKFAGVSVTKEQILGKLGLAGEEEMTAGHLESLIGFYNAIIQGDAQVDEVFPVTKDGSKVADAINKGKQKKKGRPKKEADAPAAAPEPEPAEEPTRSEDDPWWDKGQEKADSPENS